MRTSALLTIALLAAPSIAQKQVAAGPVAVEAPYSLTAADGTGLKLVGLDARAVVDGPLAFTELHLTFENPQPRVIEGHFKVTMPDGAAISRFAMKIRGSWMEGEVVEKQAARRAYEDALHRRQDPALLEQDGGNNFRARVFPIPANGRKELIISWSHELSASGEAYRLPLRGLPAVEKLTLTAMTAADGAGGAQTSLGGTTSRYQISKVDKANFSPDQDWVVFGGAVPAGGDARRSGNLSVARFVVPGDAGGETLPEAWVLFDTSASRAIGFDGRLAALKDLVGGLPSIGVKHVVVVDGDVDLFDPRQVEWAIATRFQAARDLLVLEDQPSSSLDPSAEQVPGRKARTSKLGLDATIPWDTPQGPSDPGGYRKVTLDPIDLSPYLE